MTRAEQMKAALNNFNMTWTDLLLEANEIGTAYEQDFENEITAFELPDGSVAIFSGIDQDIVAYGSKE